jgi:hypothetical protein
MLCQQRLIRATRVLGVFNQSSHHLQSWRCYGKTCEVDAEVNWTRGNALIAARKVALQLIQNTIICASDELREPL